MNELMAINKTWYLEHHGKWSDKKYFQNIYWE